MKINCVGHIGLFTNNPSRLVKFYIEKIGFREEKEASVSGFIMKEVFGIACECRLIRLTNADAKIEIISSNKTRFKKIKSAQIGYNHCSFLVKDKMRFSRDLRHKQVKVIEVKKDDGLIYFFKDPDGNRIEIQNY